MAAKAVSTGVLVVVVAVAVLVGSASAQSASGCRQAVISLSPCLNYITGNETVPSGSCCSRLSLLATSQPECLCVVITGDIFAELGFDVIKTQTLHLPDACCIKTLPCGSDVRTPSPGTETPATSAATGIGSD
jgi:hypothetical protein